MPGSGGLLRHAPAPDDTAVFDEIGAAVGWVVAGTSRPDDDVERDGVEAPHRETGLRGIRMVRGG
ncbi:MAG: hypothetical protein ACJ715_16200 [Ornithinibacter sp.]